MALWIVPVGVLLVAALGAARVRVRGLVDCVRDGVLLYVPWWNRPCEHAAQVLAVFAD